ncbi:hypothetical protein LTR37_005247 [Vermiconidia calcicola]|uniref:Uncharacterized protein n=1 Tax=Vermiconidia calcicola TaxID=1690605 RepID=A0ACC3NKV4_9PEZI|nr:hypothetical protein LTR37_005247 [Vermiconidia calcicola]
MAPIPNGTSNGTDRRRKGVYLITHPRSASNLTQKMMSQQPGVQNSGYYFIEEGLRSTFMGLQKGPLSAASEEGRTALYAQYQTSFEKLEAELTDAAGKGNQVFVKEHAMLLYRPDKLFKLAYPDDDLTPLTVRSNAQKDSQQRYTNPTILPDEFLLSMQPIFQIRHPIRMFPSTVRAMSATPLAYTTLSGSLAVKAIMTLRYTREIYDWYLAQEDAPIPKIIDADGIMESKATVRRLCEDTGLDPDSVLYEWDTWEETEPMRIRLLSTVRQSRGILPGLESKGLSMEKELPKWREEFGEDDADVLARHVRDAMPDYEYLHSRRVRCD